jgi:glutaredoxin-like YruB-family protein
MRSIQSLNEIKSAKSDYYVFVYKSDSDQSKCALTNLKNAAQNVENIYLVDVLETKDVHRSLGVKSAPTLVQMRDGEMQQQIKGCQSTGFYQTLISGERFSSFSSASGGNSSSSIIMYTTPTCTYCNSLKSYLNEKNISYTEIDVSKDQEAAEEMVKRSGQQGVPQTLINGQVVIGFDITKINQLLNID